MKKEQYFDGYIEDEKGFVIVPKNMYKRHKETIERIIMTSALDKDMLTSLLSDIYFFGYTKGEEDATEAAEEYYTSEIKRPTQHEE